MASAACRRGRGGSAWRAVGKLKMPKTVKHLQFAIHWGSLIAHGLKIKISSLADGCRRGDSYEHILHLHFILLSLQDSGMGGGGGGGIKPGSAGLAGSRLRKAWEWGESPKGVSSAEEGWGDLSKDPGRFWRASQQTKDKTTLWSKRHRLGRPKWPLTLERKP